MHSQSLVSSGVRQGPILEPVLFNTIICDVVAVIDVDRLLHADDM